MKKDEAALSLLHRSQMFTMLILMMSDSLWRFVSSSQSFLTAVRLQASQTNIKLYHVYVVNKSAVS